MLDLFGDIGGVVEVILMLTELFVKPIAEHMFLLKAIQKLFLARTTDKNLFAEKKGDKAQRKFKRKKSEMKKFSKDERRVLKQTRFIKFSSCQAF